MSVPDMRHVPKKLFDTGLYDLKSDDGHAAFTDAVVATLNGLDPRWRHLKKSAGQTNVHRHGEDSALYLHPDGTAQAVDFIVGAGGTNPGPGWGPDPSATYLHKDGHDPDDHGLAGSTQPPQPIIPSYAALGDDAFFRAHIGVPLEADMATAGQTLNNGSAVWFSRTTYSLMAAMINAGGPVDPLPIVKKHRNEWRAILGLPPLP